MLSHEPSSGAIASRSRFEPSGVYASLAEKVRRHALPGPPVEPHAAEREISAHTIAWARRVGIASGELASRQHAALRCGSFAAHTYPQAPVEVAMLAADLRGWLSLFDDRFGEGREGESEAELRACLSTFERLARTGVPPERANAFHHALHDLVERGSARGGPAWRDRFADSLAAYLQGCVQELPYRRSGRVPTFDEYRRIRVLSVGAFPMFDLIELAHREPPVRGPWQDLLLSEARRTAALLCTWVDDIHAFPERSRDGDPLDLVTVLMHAHELDAEWALSMAIARYERDLARLEDVVIHARAHGVAEVMDASLRGLLGWVHGNRAWTGSGGRY